MSVTEKKRTSVLDPALLQAITKAFSQPNVVTSSPSDQLAKLSVNTPTTASSSIEQIPHLSPQTTTEAKRSAVTEQTPLLILNQEFQLPTHTPRRSNNFLKGCKWSPDGLCLLTNSDDHQLRVFEIPCDRLPSNEDINAVLHLKEPELIYDFQWYPYMDSNQSDTCFSCRDNPVHLFDAYTGEVRASYKAFNHLEELVAAHSLGFELQSCRLYCGYDRTIRAFDIQRPGPCVTQWNTCDRTNDIHQSGIISCLSFNSQIPGMYAAGSYAKTIGIYGDMNGELIAVLHGHTGGITHIQFSADGNRLYSGARKDGMILCWDMRNLGETLVTFQREVNTNQRIYFDVDPSSMTLVTGNSNGRILGWDINDSSTPVLDFLAHNDCTNGISIHPKRPLFATSSGQRRFAGDIRVTVSEDEDEDNLFAELNVVIYLLVAIFGVSGAFQKPASNLQRLTPNVHTKDVGLDLCPTCIDEAVEAINVILNVILDEGIVENCEKLCDIVANKTKSELIGTICNLACDAVGIDEFIRLIISVDLDPIWYCEMARLCEINDHGDATFTHFGVYPNTGPQGTTFVIDCSFKSLNGTGTSMLRIDIVDSHNETNGNDFLVEAKKPGTYPERIALKTLSAWNCDPSTGFCDDFPVGTYNVTAQFCNGECGSHHPHSGTYDVGKASFTVTKKK
ncbi:unnamed protein product [Adineta ricciae]|uniref:WD repeat-containing protein 79 n=1 Tax=Adineta ricciae TaxID=249248 RepID=A0A813Y2W0_ADIRI|nr:unnamed protein product [Adineta ricciae]